MTEPVPESRILVETDDNFSGRNTRVYLLSRDGGKHPIDGIVRLVWDTDSSGPGKMTFTVLDPEVHIFR